MGWKILTNAWRLNNKKQFLSVYGVKDCYARELLYMGDIEIPEKLAIKHKIKTSDDILNLDDKKCSKILEEIGYKWVKLKHSIEV